MIVFRISSFQYHLDLSGKGAELYGGRWNTKGLPALYTADSRALAMAEVAVHLPIGIFPTNYQMVSIEIPDSSVEEVRSLDLPVSWRSFPFHPRTQQIGDEFLKNQAYLALKAPSAVVDGDYNYIVNPRHELAGKIKVVEVKQFLFDMRLLKV